MTAVKDITIFGATGSIGQSTLALVRKYPDRFSVHGLVAGQNVAFLASLAREFCPKIVGIDDETKLPELRDLLADLPIEVVGGTVACTGIATIAVDLVVAGIIGLAGLPSVMAAVKAGQVIGLANKESLVAAGAVVTAAAQASGAQILPLDSEHNAIFQCWHGWRGHDGNTENSAAICEIRKICLTASGGPFLNLPIKEFQNITPEIAVQHPNWSMGQKISVDSATMMNKGLEVIEAHWLFGLAPDLIDVLVHPQQAVHGMVYFCDGSVISQLGGTDMRTPISYAMAWPNRLPWENQPLDLVSLQSLTFFEVDERRFPCFALARAALSEGGNKPVILNAANEVAVAAFLQGRIRFDRIGAIVEACLSDNVVGNIESLDAVIAIDAAARQNAIEKLSKCHHS